MCHPLFQKVAEKMVPTDSTFFPLLRSDIVCSFRFTALPPPLPQVVALVDRSTFILGLERWGSLTSRNLFGKRKTMEREVKKVFGWWNVRINLACVTTSSAWQVPFGQYLPRNSHLIRGNVISSETILETKWKAIVLNPPHHATVVNWNIAVQSPWPRLGLEMTWHFFKVPCIW